MAISRFYVPGSLELGASVALPENTAHHLARVLRLQTGDSVILFNGEGGEFECIIETLEKKAVTVRPLSFSDDDRATSLKVHLGMCILKRDAMDNVFMKATELGVTSITPLVSDHCAVSRKSIENRQKHWKQVSISACEQCGLNILPQIDEPQQLTEWIQSRDGKRIIALPDATTPVNAAEHPSEVSLLVGPEGGFSDAEVDAASASGFEAVSFGARMLRAETAPIVALSVLQYEWGDF